jgi:acyl-CoA thioesterase
MHIDEIFQSLNDSKNQTITIADNWAQGRTVYGGLTAALVYQRMQQMVTADTPNEARPIRYFNLSFIGPLMVKEVMSIEVELLRAGRSASQLIARVKQNGKTCVLAQACFGVDRQSKINISGPAQTAMEKPEKANFIPQIPKVVPRFLRHFEINLQAGRLPFMGGKKDHLHGWMRFKKPPTQINDAHLIALIDAWPCTVLQQLRLPAPASTMNWNLEFPQTATAIHPKHWLAYQAVTEHASDGYVFCDAKVWNEAGELMALSRQTVGIFG